MWCLISFHTVLIFLLCQHKSSTQTPSHSLFFFPQERHRRERSISCTESFLVWDQVLIYLWAQVTFRIKWCCRWHHLQDPEKVSSSEVAKNGRHLRIVETVITVLIKENIQAFPQRRYLSSSLSQHASARVLYLQPPCRKAARLASPLLRTVLKPLWGLPGPLHSKGKHPPPVLLPIPPLRVMLLGFCPLLPKSTSCVPLFVHSRITSTQWALEEQLRHEWKHQGAHKPYWSSRLGYQRRFNDAAGDIQEEENSMPSFQNMWTVSSS